MEHSASDASDWLRGAAQATPEGENGASLERWLDGMNEARWKELLELLEAIATQTAPRFRDVAEADDVFGELVLLTCDRWLPRFREELRSGKARTPLWPFLKLRLAGHLSEMRRKRRRRDQLIRAEVGPWSEGDESEGVVLAAERPPGPREELFARELAELAARDPELRQVLEMRYAGHTQAEIAGALAVSRPTVSRRLGAIAALAATLLVVVLFSWWALRSGLGGEPPVIRPESPSLAPPPQPAGGPEATPPPLPLELTSDQVRALAMDPDAGLLECVALEAGPGTHRLGLRISPEGRVTLTRVVGRPRHPSFMSCISGAARRIQFPVARHTSEPEFSIDLVEPPLDPDVQACADEGDQRCIARLLGAADPNRPPEAGQRVRSLTELTLLIDAYRALGEALRLHYAVEEVREHYPDSEAARRESARLERRRLAPDEPPENPALEYTPEERSQLARACSMRGDNVCVIETLEGRATTADQLAMLIEAYRARGGTEQARRHMETLIERYRGSPQARMYAQILARMRP